MQAALAREQAPIKQGERTDLKEHPDNIGKLDDGYGTSNSYQLRRLAPMDLSIINNTKLTRGPSPARCL
jgi:hypothetical protein